MSSLEIKRVYNKFGLIPTDVCTSSVEFNFENIGDQSEIVSKKINVPKIDATW